MRILITLVILSGLASPARGCDPQLLVQLLKGINVFDPVMRIDNGNGYPLEQEQDPILVHHNFLVGVAAVYHTHPALFALYRAVKETLAPAEREKRELTRGEMQRFKEHLRTIVTRYAPGLRLAWPEDIAVLLEGYRKAGKLPSTELMQPGSFLIGYHAYGLMVLDGYLPITDVHDLFSHLPPFFVFPSYLALFQDRARQFMRLDLMQVSGVDGEYSRRAASYLKRGIRFSTYEVVPLVIGTSEPMFALWGGVARDMAPRMDEVFRGFLNWDFDAPKKLAQDMIAFDSYEGDVDPFEPEWVGSAVRLAKWKTYLEERPDARQRFQNARKLRGQTAEQSRILQGALIDIWREKVPAPPELATELTGQQRHDLTNRITSAWNTVATLAPRDSVVTRHLTPEIYLEYYAATNALLADYLDWFGVARIDDER